MVQKEHNVMIRNESLHVNVTTCQITRTLVNPFIKIHSH